MKWKLLKQNYIDEVIGRRHNAHYHQLHRK
jgi:hypothetical protein